MRCPPRSVAGISERPRQAAWRSGCVDPPARKSALGDVFPRRCAPQSRRRPRRGARQSRRRRAAPARSLKYVTTPPACGAPAAGGRTVALQPGPQQLLALLGALAALRLRLAEEVRELAVAVALGVLDVLLQAQRVAQAGLGEPDDVVVLVLGTGELAGLAGARHCSSSDNGLSRRRTQLTAESCAVDRRFERAGRIGFGAAARDRRAGRWASWPERGTWSPGEPGSSGAPWSRRCGPPGRR